MTCGTLAHWANKLTVHVPPPAHRQTPRHCTFLKNFGQIPRYVELALRKVLNPHPPATIYSKTVPMRQTVLDSNVNIILLNTTEISQV